MRKMHVILQFVKQNAFYLSEGWVGGTKGEKFYLKKGQIPLKIYLSSFIPFSVMTTLKQRHTACFSIATFTLPREKKTLYSFNGFISMKSCQNTSVWVSENKTRKRLYE